ncbi:hypothetical protein LUZ60_002709 [Juncus effusus]|nr:hypothetical protein LUZ60_002709 [Juncus effusus]
MRRKLKQYVNSHPLVAKISIFILFLTALILILVTTIHRSNHKSSPNSPSLPKSPPPPPPPPHAIPFDSNNTIQFDFSPYLKLYKNGSVERLSGTQTVSAGFDSTSGVTSKDVVINSNTGLSARLYLPKSNITSGEKFPILIFIHGGAFVIESAFSPTYHDYLNALVSEAKVITVSVNYRLAPEHPLPTAYNDSFEAFKWTVSNAKTGPENWLNNYGDLSRLFLSGDSAGGNIAHNVALMGGVNIKGLALLDPYFWGKNPVGSETTDLSVRNKMEITWEFVCANKYTIDNPVVNPIGSPNLFDKLSCERVLVMIAELDTFRERGKAYVDELKKSGWNGEVQLYETKGEDHVYFLYQLQSDKAKKEMAFLASFLNGS